MKRTRSGAALLGALLLCAPAPAASVKADRYAGADELAARIDRLMDDAWKKANVTPARPADDAEWVRRIYLDLAGRIPSVTEARSFLGDRRTDKRQRLVESLLAGQRYPTHFASLWLALLAPEANDNPRLQAQAFQGWLRKWLASGRGYDWMVRELLTPPNQLQRQMREGPFAPAGGREFYIAKENKPEDLAAAASRLFLGVNLGCAQCHNHPFASWKRDQFWSFAAFFSSGQGRGRVRGDRREATVAAANQLMIPGTDKVVKAKYLDGKDPSFEPGAPGQKALVDWMTATDNPYFARAAANRLWAHFFGAGLVEPLDEMVGGETLQSHPAVLDELAGAFTKSQYDPHWLIRAITATRAYHLTSARSHASQDDPRQFARMALRGLSGQQLYDSLAQATGYRDEAFASRGNPLGFGASRYEFVTKFNSSERPGEKQTSILQALTLMNGKVMTAATSIRMSEALLAVVDSPFLDVPGKIEALCLATLSRKPSAKELSRLTRYVEKSGVDRTASPRESSNRQGEALADVFWALLNSAEFSVNH